MITGAAAVTVSTRVAVPVPPLWVAEIVTLAVPVAVGVPVIAPVAVSMARPAGRLVALKEAGVFEAVIW